MLFQRDRHRRERERERERGLLISEKLPFSVDIHHKKKKCLYTSNDRNELMQYIYIYIYLSDNINIVLDFITKMYR